jgi:hypothetical protein
VVLRAEGRSHLDECEHGRQSQVHAPPERRQDATDIRPTEILGQAAASTLGGAKLGAAAFGPGYAISAQEPLAFMRAAELVAGIGVIVALLATRTEVRHDVT